MEFTVTPEPVVPPEPEPIVPPESEPESEVGSGASEGIEDLDAQKLATTTSQATIGAAAFVCLLTSIFNTPSFSGFYLILQQLQMIILVLMIDPFIPDSLLKYLDGQDLVMVTFNFIPVSELPAIKTPVNWFDSEQSNEILNVLGIESRSTLVNKLPLFAIMTLIFIIHVLLRFFSCGEGAAGQSSISRFFRKVRTKVLDMIKYSLYLRLLLEAHEAMLLSSSQEIYLYELNETSDYVSYSIA